MIRKALIWRRGLWRGGHRLRPRLRRLDRLRILLRIGLGIGRLRVCRICGIWLRGGRRLILWLRYRRHNRLAGLWWDRFHRLGRGADGALCVWLIYRLTRTSLQQISVNVSGFALFRACGGGICRRGSLHLPLPGRGFLRLAVYLRDVITHDFRSFQFPLSWPAQATLHCAGCFHPAFPAFLPYPSCGACAAL